MLTDAQPSVGQYLSSVSPEMSVDTWCTGVLSNHDPWLITTVEYEPLVCAVLEKKENQKSDLFTLYHWFELNYVTLRYTKS